MDHRTKRIRTPASAQQAARELCRRMTPAEALLWSRLRNAELDGLKFRRQHPPGPFITGFCCPSQRLIVEVDGDIHDYQAEQDAARTEEFARHGYRVVRFRNERVLNDVEAVLAAIRSACRSSSLRRRWE